MMRTSAAYRDAPIGVMDSGVGGLSILRELHRQLPGEDYLFIADQYHVPYGEKSLAQVRGYVEGITRFLLDQGVKLIVIACNTASAAALHPIRAAYPEIKFVGMEPAIKPAAEHTRTGKIGVIATAATFQGKLYASLLDRFAKGLDVHTRACPEFVELVERGGPYTQADVELVGAALESLLEADIDQLVLGCTHFPFLIPLIQQNLNGRAVTIIDPSAAVARQVGRVLRAADALNPQVGLGTTVYASTGDNLRPHVTTLMNVSDPDVRRACWEQGRLAWCE